jgi:acetyl esterase/lipase
LRITIAILIFQFLLANASAQSLAGITGIHDTSYSVSAEYAKHVKNYPDIKIAQPQSTGKLKQQLNVPYCKLSSRSLSLDVFSLPKNGKVKRTAIIIIHGGGWRSGDKSLHHPLAQQLAQIGYTCFTPAYRLSTEALFPAAVYDVKAAVRWVRANAKKYNIDTKKVVVLGHSAGGELAAFLGATNGNSDFEGETCNLKFSSTVNAVIDIDGTLAFIHPESGEGDDSKRTSAATYWFGYSKTENPEVWKQASPLTHIGKSTPPVLFLNSMVERMHAGRDDFTKVLQTHGTYVEVKTYEGAPHSFCLFEPWFTPMVSDIDQFIKRVFP